MLLINLPPSHSYITTPNSAQSLLESSFYWWLMLTFSTTIPWLTTHLTSMAARRISTPTTEAATLIRREVATGRTSPLTGPICCPNIGQHQPRCTSQHLEQQLNLMLRWVLHSSSVFFVLYVFLRSTFTNTISATDLCTHTNVHITYVCLDLRCVKGIRSWWYEIQYLSSS